MIPYTHKTHPRSRSIKIKVEHNGQVVVVTPKGTPKKVIENFVNHNQMWIQNALEKIKSKLPTISDDQISVFGKNYQIKIDNTLKVGVYTQGNHCLVSLADPLAESKNKIKKQLDHFLKFTAEKYIIPRTHQLASIMDTTFERVSLKQQKTRWGSCSSQGNLNFNWRLVHYKPEIIDYVIIHELAHRTHMNHSRKFWQLVSTFDPDYRQHRGWLKRHGMTLG